MGRTSKRSETALTAAAEMLGTTKNQTVRAQLIRIVIDYDLRQQERADSRKAERHERAENKQLAELRLKVKDLTDKLSSAERSKEKEVSDIRDDMAGQKIAFAKCKEGFAKAELEADKARGTTAEMQKRLGIAQELTVQLARNVSAESRFDCASNLFLNLRSGAPELLDQLFKSMELDLKTWRIWDSEYGKNTDLMLRVVLSPKKHEPEKLSLLRSKLAAMGKDYVNAINAMCDYRDLKIGLDQLKELTSPHINFANLESSWLPITNHIPEEHMPRLTQEALRIASERLKNDPLRTLEWLNTVEKLLKPDDGVGGLLLMEKQAARLAANESNGHKE